MLDLAKIRELRKGLKLTQAEIAARAGVSLPRWNDIEKGRKPNITLDTLDVIARVLGCDPADLLAVRGKRKAVK